MFIPFCIPGVLAGRSVDLRPVLHWCGLGGFAELRWFALLACVPVGNGSSESNELWLCNSCVTQLIAPGLL